MTDALPAGGLTDSEREMLALERLHWKEPSAKDAVLVERFGVSPTRFAQRVNALIERPEALAFDAVTVNRLRRLRARTRRASSARRLGGMW